MTLHDHASDAPGVTDLRSRGIPHRIIHPGHVTSVEEAAAACGVAPGQVVKTLVIRRGEGDHVLVLIPGDRTLSWPKLRHTPYACAWQTASV